MCGTRSASAANLFGPLGRLQQPRVTGPPTKSLGPKPARPRNGGGQDRPPLGAGVGSGTANVAPERGKYARDDASGNDLVQALRLLQGIMTPEDLQKNQGLVAPNQKQKKSGTTLGGS